MDEETRIEKAAEFILICIVIFALVLGVVWMVMSFGFSLPTPPPDWSTHTESAPLSGAYVVIGMPNSAMTPGSTNSDVTQATIGKTICVKGWTATPGLRPTSAYTTKLKNQQLASLGVVDQNAADYEEDHLISLELGGNPVDPQNLWPEPYCTSGSPCAASDPRAGKDPYGAKAKDKVENWLKAQVCSGGMTLVKAQTLIRTDWGIAQAMMQAATGPGHTGAIVSDNDPDDD